MRLEEILDIAKKSKFYSKRIGKKFQEIPLLKKEDIIENPLPKSSAMLTKPLRKAYIYSSGGTTRKPAYTIYSFEEFDRSTEVLTEMLSPLIDSSDVIANLHIPGNLWTAYYAFCNALERLDCLLLPIGGGVSFDSIADTLESFGGNTLIGVPSFLVAFSNYLEQNQIKLEIKKILYGGEFLSVNSAEMLKRVTGAKEIYSALYGIVESGPIASQCKKCEGTSHHIAQDYHYVEILDENLKPIEEKGKVGRVVITNLDRTLMPIIRFDTGDFGEWSDCCGGFELRGRAGTHIQIGCCHLTTDELESVVFSFCRPVAMQTVLTQTSSKDCILVQIESLGEVNEKLLKERITDEFKDMKASIDKKILSLRIKQVPIGTLKRDRKTGKIKKLVDERRIA
ncbi:MAG TPA: phenylacetate--CoA ligase family protein [Thermoplasmata archaeon]|nr:phenylacetate--CoA ligase family protein [Thermoplasmata archaeon]